MILSHCRDAYYDASARASDAARQLAIGAVAIAWIFKGDGKTPPSAQELAVRWMLFRAIAAAAVSLALDVIQYAYKAAAWGFFSWRREREHLSKFKTIKEDAECAVPETINWPVIGAFWLKLVALLVSYTYLARFLAASGAF